MWRTTGTGTLASFTPNCEGVPARITKRVIHDLDTAISRPDAAVPFLETVHDRVTMETSRGCIRGCRFCQAGYTYRPVRPRSPETLRRQAIESLENSGCHEITLSSLSTSDYRGLPELADAMLDYCAPRKINLSLPSLRADNFSRDLMLRLQQVRKSGPDVRARRPVRSACATPSIRMSRSRRSSIPVPSPLRAVGTM